MALEGKRIFVAGGAGSIGSELVRQLVAGGNSVYVFDINETDMFDLVEILKLDGRNVAGRVGDVRNLDTVEEAFFEARPDLVFHCAALKHVAPNEGYPEEAVRTNVLGTINLVKVAKRHGVERFVFISSDKAVSGASVMGATKRLAELIVRNAGYTCVRFANVLGSRGSIVPIWQRAIDTGRPVTVTDERMLRFFMTIEEACALVLSAAEDGESATYVLDMGEKVSVLDLAKRIIKESGRDIPIKMIGARAGETFEERLMTPEEEGRAEKKNNFWIIK